MNESPAKKHLQLFRKLNFDLATVRKEKENATRKIAALTAEKLRIQKKVADAEMRAVELRTIGDPDLGIRQWLALKIESLRTSHEVALSAARRSRDELRSCCEKAATKEVLLLEKMDELTSAQAAYINLQSKLETTKKILLRGENRRRELETQNSKLLSRTINLINENSLLKKEAARSSKAIRAMENSIAEFKNKIRLFRSRLEAEIKTQDRRLTLGCAMMRKLAAWTYAGALKVRDMMDKERALKKEIVTLEKYIERQDECEASRTS